MIKKIEIPEWFDLGNYKAIRYIDPGYWAWQLQARLIILDHPCGGANINTFNKIMEKGLYGIDWDYPEGNGRFSQGIAFPSTSIDKANLTIKLTEETKQHRLKDKLITEGISVIDFECFVDYFNRIDDSLLDSLDRKDELWHGDDMELNESDLDVINNTNELFHNVVNTDNKVLIEVDLHLPDDLIKSNFNCVLRALRNKEKSLPLNVKSLRVETWGKKSNKLLSSKIIPYLDLFIYCKLTGNSFTFEEYDDILFGSKYDYPKARRTTHPLAFKMMESEYTSGLWDLYYSKPTTYWRNKSIDKK